MTKTIQSSKTIQTPFNKALKYISYKNRSLKEVHDYLVKNNYSDEQIKETIEKLIEYKFVDDEKFSEIFIRNRQLKGRSKKMISYELRQKGINKETLEQSLSDAQNDFKTAKEYIEKRLHQMKNLEPEKRTQRIINRLKSRGYNWDTIKKVLNYIETIS